MHRNDEHHDDELIDLGSVIAETKGANQGQSDAEGQPRSLIGGISDGGPADRAGLQRGDVLHALNDEVLDDVADFYRKLWESGPAGPSQGQGRAARSGSRPHGPVRYIGTKPGNLKGQGPVAPSSGGLPARGGTRGRYRRAPIRRPRASPVPARKRPGGR